MGDSLRKKAEEFSNKTEPSASLFFLICFHYFLLVVFLDPVAKFSLQSDETLGPSPKTPETKHFSRLAFTTGYSAFRLKKFLKLAMLFSIGLI